MLQIYEIYNEKQIHCHHNRKPVYSWAACMNQEALHSHIQMHSFCTRYDGFMNKTRCTEALEIMLEGELL